MVREGYKQTEVGEIPEDWDVCALGNIATLERGKFSARPRNDPKFFGGKLPFIQTGDITRSNGKEVGFSQTLNEEGLKVSKSFPENTLYFTIAANIGDLAIVPFAAACPDSLIAIKPVEAISKEWLYHALRSRKSHFQLIATSNAQLNINLEKLNPYLLSVPKIFKEQQSIAKALSDVDDLIVSLEKLIAKKRDIKTATMQQLLMGKKRLSGYEGEWSTLSIEKDATLNARIGWQALTTSEYLESGDFFLVTGTDFINGRVNWSTCHCVDEWRYSQDKKIQLKERDVLLTKDGTIGKVGFVENLEMPATLNSGVFVIRPRDNIFDPLFLFYILNSRVFDDFLSKITAGSTITHLYQKDFVGFEFQAPKIEEQKAISNFLEAIDRDIGFQEGRLRKIKSIKQGMMQELLTGRTRLVDVNTTNQNEEERMHGT